MPPWLFEAENLQLPPSRWAVAAWLIAPARSIGLEGDSELRQTMMRRLEAVLFSTAVSVLVELIAVARHPILPLGIWLCLEIILQTFRVPIVIYMLRLSRNTNVGGAMPPWITDAFVGLGTLWSALLGWGTLCCLSTSDPGLSVIAALLAMGTIGAQAARNPGSPRLNCLQMCLIMVPFMAGALLSKIPLMDWILLLAPMYLAGMISITRQLHEDYVALLISRTKDRDRSLHCPLTNLPNRACMDEALKATLRTAHRDGRTLLIMYLDLDGFKAVNDKFGHAAGDALLVQVAGRLRIWSQSQSFVARLGGDEFAILLSTDDPQKAESEAQTLIDSLGCSYDLGANCEARIGVSIGLASSAPNMDAGTLTLHADTALYEAKRDGKGLFRWYNKPPLFVVQPGRFERRLTEETGADHWGCNIISTRK
jgi:diguanylate cyclase (GGDEF)-like protein